MRKTAHLFAVAAFVAAALPLPSAASSGTFNATRARDVVSLSSPTISPDGKRAVVVVSRVNWKDDKNERNLDIFDLTTHARRTLTYKRQGLSDPAFSPDGTRLAFIANAGSGDDAKAQVFVMPLDGGDARPVTSDEGGVEQFAWRPDGEAIAYAADEPKPRPTGIAKYRDAFVFTTEPITTREPDRPVHLFVVSATGEGKARQLTRGPQSVATGEAQSTLSWSADGTTLTFLLAPNAILNDVMNAHLELLDVATAKLTRLTTNANFEGGALFSPDGKHVAYEHSAGDSQVNRNDAYITTPGSGNGTDVSAAYDRQVHEAFWSADSATLNFTCANGTILQLVRTGLDAKPKAVDLGDLNLTTVSAGTSTDGTIVFIGTKTDAPGELYTLRADGTSERISDYNVATRALSLAKSEKITFDSSMGVMADGVLYYPPGYAAGKTYPLVLYVHGGPTSSSATVFDSFAQSLAARGWLVLEPNYRGSDNLGLKYQRGVLYDPGEGPGKDIMAAVAAVEAKGIVDTHRIAVSGWSYGGIMTAWMISKYHIWRAAVSGASVNDWATDYGVADDSESDAALFHGSPFVRNAYTSEWKRASAVTYAPDVTTPVLIISDAGDNRDPFATSSMYYRALRDNHKNVTFVQYPVDGHFPRDPVRRADVIDRFGDYIAAHFH